MVRFVLESGTLRPGTLRQWYASSDIQYYTKNVAKTEDNKHFFNFRRLPCLSVNFF